jgi:diaminopimelate decarboxylase
MRINPPWGIAEKRTIIGGPGAKKFGFDIETAARELESREELTHLAIEGFQVFNASNVLDADLLTENAENVVELAAELADRFHLVVSSIDFGGGFGVPYSTEETPLDLEVLSRGLARVADRAAGHPKLKDARLIFEPGRFLAAPIGIYVTRVLGTKQTMGMRYALVDGGIHHLVRPVLIGATHRVAIVGNPERESVPVAIAGPLCTSLDVLHPGAMLPDPRRGDLLAFENAGAYGYTESMPLFLSHEWAREIGCRHGRLEQLRQPPTVNELLDAQRMPFD